MQLNSEDRLVLDAFKPRPYQEEVEDMIFNRGCKRLILCWARRGGKDFTLFNIAVRWCLQKPCSVYYAGETYGAIRQIVWDNKTNDGTPFLDYIPQRLIEKKNESRMRITFINGSYLQFVGADSHKTSFRGSNPTMVILSEYAYYDDPTVIDTISPILAANSGVLCLASTPQGKNSYHQIYSMAKELPDWWVSTKTVDDMGHIDRNELEKERKRMSQEKFLQEYYVDFNRGVDGAIFGKEIHRMRREGRITSVAWEPGLLVHTFWDLGISKGNENCILFVQICGGGTVIRIIDCYSSANLGLDTYAAIIQEKGQHYKYGVHVAPHDIEVRENSDGISRWQKAQNLGLDFVVLKQTLLADQIENTLTHINKVWIDEVKCKSLLNALENYYREWDEQRQVYRPKPVHNWACFVEDTLILTKKGLKRIIDIQQDDLILTLEGWKKCNKAKLMKKNARLVEVTFVDGTKVKCTPEHKFLTVNGWISAECLTKDSKILSSLMHLRNTSMDHSIDYGQPKSILLKAAQHYIEMFGLKHLVQYLKNLISTIWTTIKQTITYGIYSACLKMNIGSWIGLMHEEENQANYAYSVAVNGGSLKQESYGIKDTKKDKQHGLYGKEKCAHAYDAVKNSIALLDQTGINKNIVEIPVGLCLIESVKHLKETADVYCINVPEVRHFSLSNGAIVHNSNFSSAFMAIFLGLEHCYTNTPPETYDKIRNEALYGRKGLPRIFEQGMKNSGY